MGVPLKMRKGKAGGFPWFFLPISFSLSPSPHPPTRPPPPSRAPRTCSGRFCHHTTERKVGHGWVRACLEPRQPSLESFPTEHTLGSSFAMLFDFWVFFIMVKMMIYFGRSAEPAPVVQAGRRGRREVVWEMEVGMDLFLFCYSPIPSEILSCKNRSTACQICSLQPLCLKTNRSTPTQASLQTGYFTEIVQRSKSEALNRFSTLGAPLEHTCVFVFRVTVRRVKLTVLSR